MFDEIPFHPMIVHFPIALLISGFLFDLSGLILKKDWLTRAAVVLLVLGTLGAIGAKISGEAEEDRILVNAELEEHIETHEEAGKLAMWIFITLSVVRATLLWIKKYPAVMAWIFVVAWLGGLVALGLAASYGGHLVYVEGAGVALEHQKKPESAGH